ncbi:MAG TPA: M15 family metallopeptidase [Anaeromyxobacter sp.]|nr:M15 family metallopeptidase [Anaeromyxobacter sp.]
MPSPAAALLALLASAAPGPAAPPLVDAAALVPDALLELRYATPRNVTGRALYPRGARCLLRPDVALRLVRAADLLRARGYRLRLWDCYRPPSVQRILFAAVPRPGYVADPSRGGSHHGRGAAVDLGLAGRDGGDIELPTDFDDFGPRARAAAVAGVSPAARAHRDALRAAMVAAGFEPSRSEWWHFSAPEAHGAPQLEAPLLPP